MNAASRMQAVQSPIIPVIGELIRAHPGTISLGQGVVHYGPPLAALEGLLRLAAEPQHHRYHAVEGMAALREALETKLREENGIRLGPETSLVVTAGGNMAFFNVLLAIADPGDEIVLLAPYYFNHEMAITMLNCRPALVPLDANYQIDLAALEATITPRTRAVVTVSPNNPSGAVYPPATLRAVNQLCRERGLYHISDEAYEYFVYDGAEHFSAGSLPDSAGYTISLYSLSKAFGMASWRVGYMTLPSRLLTAVKKAQDTILICPPVMSQAVAAAAVRGGSAYCREKIAGLAEVRAAALEQLNTLGACCEIPAANGAFYFLLKLDTQLADMTLVERLIREHGVAVIPGSTFGLHQGCYLRVAYGALDRASVAEGIGRLVRGLKHILKTE